MKTSLLLFITLILAALTHTIPWSPELADHVQQARARGLTQQPPACDLNNAVMPMAPTPLPSPDPSWILREVTIGRGVQNYTCAVASPDYTPVAIGAIAFLYNASCIAATNPDILFILPSLALQFPLLSYPFDALKPSILDLSGNHYFATNTTPIFNLNASPDPARRIGTVVAHKAANSTAPENATKGENGVGNGAVTWLYLNTTNATQGDVGAVYRVNTAGGSPPQTCEGSDAVFSVQYAAEYWFYSKLYEDSHRRLSVYV